jgi:hypothetical protein
LLLIDDLANVTQLQVERVRSLLRVLLGKEIVLHPTADGTARYLTAEVSGDYAGLLRLAVGQHKFGGGQANTPGHETGSNKKTDAKLKSRLLPSDQSHPFLYHPLRKSSAVQLDVKPAG